MKNMSELFIAALIIAAAIVWHSFTQRYQGVESNGAIYIVDGLTGKMRLCAFNRYISSNSDGGYVCLVDSTHQWDKAKREGWLKGLRSEPQ